MKYWGDKSFVDDLNSHDVQLETAVISTGINTGIGALATTINKNSDKLGGIKASWTVLETGVSAIAAGSISSLEINGVNIGNIDNILTNDRDGKLINAINNAKDLTGVEAYTDERGNLNLRSTDGRGINISATGADTVMGLDSTVVKNYGRLTLTKYGAKDIIVSGGAAGLTAGMSTGA